MFGALLKEAPCINVSEIRARREGRIGRSWGCPAVRPEISRRLIEAVQGGALLFACYPEKSWLRSSTLARPSAETPAMHAHA